MTQYPGPAGTPGGGGGGSQDPPPSTGLAGTRLAFARQVLQGLGVSPDHQHLVALLAWMAGENTEAQFNPFATTHDMPGGSEFNSVGVQNYTSFDQGVKATIATIKNGNYGDVIAALSDPNATAEAITNAVKNSPWGTQQFPIDQVEGDFQSYASIQLGQQGGSGGGGGAGGGGGGGGGGTGFKDVNTLPGVEGKDYHFVKYNGKTYVVYAMDLGTVGKTIRMAWRVTKDQEALGATNAVNLSREQFKNLQVFGDASLITASNENVHPWQTYVQQLQQIYGHVGWLNDAGYMRTMMLGWFEGWDSTTLAQALTTTKWYQQQTDWERQWTTKAKSERQAETKGMAAQMDQAMQSLYGDENPWNKSSGYTDADLKKWSQQVMSGKYGDPQTGFQIWLNERKKEAQSLNGTPAWMDAQQAIQSQNQFRNGPEELFSTLRDQAGQWLGYGGQNNPNISTDTLKSWSRDLFMGTKSQTDWEAFLQNQAHAMYPYLPTGTSWQQFADPYKSRAEQLYGQPVDWSNPILQNLGGTDSSGAPTGSAMSFDNFERQVRHTDAFWDGDIARTEGFSMLSNLDSLFNGTSYG